MAGSPAALTFPLLRRKSVIGRFDGGDITSDAGLPLIAQADRKLRLLDRMCAGIRDRRDQSRVRHSLLDVVRSRTYAIAMRCEDANDLDTLADDAALRMACGRFTKALAFAPGGTGYARRAVIPRGPTLVVSLTGGRTPQSYTR